MEPIAVITKQDVIERILAHLSIPPQPIAPGSGAIGCDVTGEPIPEWVVGVDPDPPELEVDERGPPGEAYFVDPPAPDE
jgi:hypothetical protein